MPIRRADTAIVDDGACSWEPLFDELLIPNRRTAPLPDELTQRLIALHS